MAGLVVVLLMVICGSFEGQAADSQNYPKVPWRGSVEEMKKVYPALDITDQSDNASYVSNKTF